MKNSSSSRVIVETENGLIEGRKTRTQWGRNVAFFCGIPYAAPPVGELRWRPPRPRNNWKGVLKCLKYSKDAPQLSVNNVPFMRNFLAKHNFGSVLRAIIILLLEIYWNFPLVRKIGQDEDCLYLNIETPDASLWDLDPHAQRLKLLPVMVFIHGGDFHDGSGGRRYFYSSRALPARGNVVLVTFNYRLGIFGNFTHPSLSKKRGEEGFAPVSGNYGFLDQVAVLQWVRRNISSFGGNPENVTICGTSAGGESAVYMMCSPLARGLFHRAIVQSPGSAYDHVLRLREPIMKFHASEDNGVAFAKRLTGGSFSRDEEIVKMRAMPVETIMEQYRKDASALPEPLQLFYPVVDGVVLPKNILETFRNGEQAIVPLIIGYSKHEGSLCFPVTMHQTAIRDSLYPSPVRKAGPCAYGVEDTATLVKLYNEAVMGEIREESISWEQRGETGCVADQLYLTERVFCQKVLWLANHHALHPEAPPIYMYQFCREPQTPGQTIGAYHCSELPFMFGSSKVFLEGSMSQDEVKLSRSMVDYWASFCRSGHPNDDYPEMSQTEHYHDRPFWHEFKGTHTKDNYRIILDRKITMENVDEALLGRISIIHKSVHTMVDDFAKVGTGQTEFCNGPILEE